MSENSFNLVMCSRRKDPPANNSSSGTSKQSNSPQRTTPNPAKKRKPSTPKASKSTPMVIHSIYWHFKTCAIVKIMDIKLNMILINLSANHSLDFFS